MLEADWPVRRIAHLDQQRRTGLVGYIQSRSMDSEVAEEQHILGFGGTEGGLLNGILSRRQMGTALMDKLYSPFLKLPGTTRMHPFSIGASSKWMVAAIIVWFS